MAVHISPLIYAKFPLLLFSFFAEFTAETVLVDESGAAFVMGTASVIGLASVVGAAVGVAFVVGAAFMDDLV